MTVTLDVELPTEEELTVPEINLTSSALKAGSFHLGKACEFENNEFVLCRNELNDPRKCIEEGKAVTSCAMKFFQSVKKSCPGEFSQYATCLDKSSTNHDFTVCRKTQAVYDKCVLDKLKIERPYYGYFSEIKVHKTERPKPPIEPPAVYPDAPPALPECADTPPAKYGSRLIFLW